MSYQKIIIGQIKNIDYKDNKSNGWSGAHNRACRWEGNSFGNSNPGSPASYQRPELTRAQRGIMSFILDSYSKGTFK